MKIMRIETVYKKNQMDLLELNNILFGIKNSLDEKSDALNTEEKRLFKTQIETIQIELQ